MATGALIATGIGGVAGSISAGNKADDAMDSAMGSINTGISEIEKYMQQANIHGEDALAFAQQQLTDWEDTFGSVEENLADYYQNLDPAKYAEQYKSGLNENIDKQLKQLNDTMSATGLQTSGMQAQAAKEAAFAKAQGAAGADLMADDKVNAMKQGFLNTGANQKASANSAMGNAYGNLANIQMNAGNAVGGMYGSQANLNQQQAKQYAGDSAGFMQGGLQGLASGTTNLFGATSENDSLKGILGNG